MIELEQFIPFIGTTASHPDLVSFIGQSGLKFERFIFNSVFFYSANDIGYARFSGSLPYGISLDDDRLTIIKKVSQPPSFVRYYDDDTIVAMDRWDFKRYSLAINYHEADLSIRSGQITFPWPQRSKLLSPDYEPFTFLGSK